MRMAPEGIVKRADGPHGSVERAGESLEQPPWSSIKVHRSTARKTARASGMHRSKESLCASADDVTLRRSVATHDRCDFPNQRTAFAFERTACRTTESICGASGQT